MQVDSTTFLFDIFWTEYWPLERSILIRSRAWSVIINKSAWHTYCRLGTRTIIYVNLWSCTHVFACQTAEQPILPSPSHPCVINVDTEFSIFTKFQCQIRNTWTLPLSRSVQCEHDCHQCTFKLFFVDVWPGAEKRAHFLCIHKSLIPIHS